VRIYKEKKQKQKKNKKMVQAGCTGIRTPVTGVAARNAAD